MYRKGFWILTAFCLIPQCVCPQPVGSCGTMADCDGNVYQTVVVGGRCWMRENLRVTHYADGRPLMPGRRVSATEHSYFYPDGDARNAVRYGLLYSWLTAMNGAQPTEDNPSRVQGICPAGWHLPSNFEWMAMEDAVGYDAALRCGSDVNNVAKPLAANDGWYHDFMTRGRPCSIVESLPDNNRTGFSVLPAGDYNGTYDGYGKDCGFWTASEGSTETSPIHRFYYMNATVEINCTPKTSGYSVRCVKD